MSKLNLISTGQCAKILGKKPKEVRALLQKHEIDFVRDNHAVFKISLESALAYARENKTGINTPYLNDLQGRLKPWYEDKQGFYAALDDEGEDEIEEDDE